MPKLLLALDQGTTSTRAILFDRTGRLRFQAQEELRQIYPRDGWVEHDPEEIWRASLEVCRAALEAAGAEGVEAIGITNQRETAVVWDRATGAAIHNALVWQDRRGAERCRVLARDGREPMVASRTGLLLDSYFSATKVEWLLDNVPGARERAERGELAFGTVDSFLIWRLTGGRVHASDVTNAARTLLFNIGEERWDDELLRLFRVPAAIMPEVRDSAGRFGSTPADLLGRPLPIAGVAGDQQAAAIGQACLAPGLAKCTYGTGAFLIAHTGERRVASGNRLLSTIAWRIRGETRYALEGSIFNAGTTMKWLRDELGMLGDVAESAELAGGLPDCGGVYFVPAFTGLGAPWWDPDARGAILGLGRDTTRAHIARAALEAVAFQTVDLIEAMTADGLHPPEVLRVDGGMVANDWLLQCLADMLGIPVERPAVGETTALGAALLAGLGAGVYRSLDEIAGVRRPDRRAEPRIDAARREACRAGWRAAVARVRTRALA